jgi:hypothetical protein
MAFVYEKVSEQDREFWEILGFKGFKGDSLCPFTSRKYWCADRERKAYLNCVGKGGPETPLIYELWWQGGLIRIWIEEFLTSDVSDSEKQIINGAVSRILIPKKLWDKQDEIILLIAEALKCDESYYSTSMVPDGDVEIKCSPECV